MTVCVGLMLVSCTGSYSVLDPAGPSARSVAALWWGMSSFAITVLLCVTTLWLYAIKRNPEEDNSFRDDLQHRRWLVGGGLVLPTASITVLLLFGIPIGQQMLPVFSESVEVLRIDVTGQQWRWEVSYPDFGVSLDNELHIPAGMPVQIHLRANDVIHAFWVPRLAGKLDAIPGHVNVLRLEADAPGLYHGQCAEFCGLGHAHMQFTVQAHAPAAFEIWLQENRSDE